MNDRQVPEVDLDELMEKIRAEVLSRKAGTTGECSQPQETPISGSSAKHPISMKWNQVENAISMAEQVSQVGAQLPGMHTFKGWTRRIALFAAKIYLRVSQVITRDQRAFNGSVLAAVNSLQEVTKYIYDESQQNHSSLQKEINEFRTLFKAIESNTNRLEELSKRLIETDSLIGENTSKLQNENQTLNCELMKAQQRIDYIKTSLLSQDRRLTLLIEEARRCMPGPFTKEQLSSFVEKAGDNYDPLYFEFEDQFRGTRDDIKGRQRIYLPYIRDAQAGTEERPVLDLGCGRGEWLELLKEEGCVARGVDMNTAMISLCRDLGLDVTRSDALKYLRDLPGESMGAVTGFHIIEHLPFEVLIQLLDETVRILKPGGIAVFETPNPQNVMVGSCNFYFDPTHRNPLPSPVIKFLAEARGLCRVSVLDLHPCPESYWLTGSELAERFSQLFYGPQDYAVVGWKA